MADKSKKIFAEVNMSQDTLRGPLPHYKNFYDEETKQLVREVFKKDFEKYHYNKIWKFRYYFYEGIKDNLKVKHES
jgi:hypothetical protein